MTARCSSTHSRQQTDYIIPLFYVLLTVHPNTKIVFFYQLDAKISYFNTFVTFLYMIRTLLCLSSGGKLC